MMPHTTSPHDLAVLICTHDSARTIERTMSSVRGLARQVVVVDSGSTDGTIEICKSFGANVIHRDWDGPTIQKQFGLEQCAGYRWVLVLDSDESLEPELADSVRGVLEGDDPAYEGWEFNRKVWFMGGWLHHTFQPEWRLRLVRSGCARFVGIGEGGRGGHDRAEVNGRVGRLRGDCRHDSWADLTDMFHKLLGRAVRAAKFNERGGSVCDILIRPPAAMFKQLVMKRAALDGWRGLIVAGAVSAGVLMKHLFIAQRRMGVGQQ